MRFLEGHHPAYDLTYNDVRVRNVVTNIRDWAGGAIANGNSIFVFEIAGLCIGHLGHLLVKHRVSRKAKNVVRIAIFFYPFHCLNAPVMTVAAPHDAGVGPTLL